MSAGGLEALAKRQWGVFSRAQARAIGISARQLLYRERTGRVERVSLTVLRIVGSRETWQQDLMSAVLRAGANALVSHRFAARLWNWSFEARPYRGGRSTVDVTIPFAESVRGDGPRVHRARWLPREHYRVKDSIPVTSPFRTLVDLAPTVSSKELEAAAGSAIRAGHITLEELRKDLAIAPHGHRGVRILKAHLPAVSEKSDSAFEDRLFAAIARAGLPRPVAKHPVVTKLRTVHPDFCYPEIRLVIEAQSVEHHTKPSVLKQDAKRFRYMNRAGWDVFELTLGRVGERGRRDGGVARGDPRAWCGQKKEENSADPPARRARATRSVGDAHACCLTSGSRRRRTARRSRRATSRVALPHLAESKTAFVS